MIPQCQGKTRETCCHCCDLIILSDQRLSKRAGARRLAPRVPKRTESGTTWIVLHDRLCRQSWLMVARGKNINDRKKRYRTSATTPPNQPGNEPQHRTISKKRN